MLGVLLPSTKKKPDWHAGTSKKGNPLRQAIESRVRPKLEERARNSPQVCPCCRPIERAQLATSAHMNAQALWLLHHYTALSAQPTSLGPLHVQTSTQLPPRAAKPQTRRAAHTLVRRRLSPRKHTPHRAALPPRTSSRSCAFTVDAPLVMHAPLAMHAPRATARYGARHPLPCTREVRAAIDGTQATTRRTHLPPHCRRGACLPCAHERVSAHAAHHTVTKLQLRRSAVRTHGNRKAADTPPADLHPASRTRCAGRRSAPRVRCISPYDHSTIAPSTPGGERASTPSRARCGCVSPASPPSIAVHARRTTGRDDNPRPRTRACPCAPAHCAASSPPHPPWRDPQAESERAHWALTLRRKGKGKELTGGNGSPGRCSREQQHHTRVNETGHTPHAPLFPVFACVHGRGTSSPLPHLLALALRPKQREIRKIKKRRDIYPHNKCVIVSDKRTVAVNGTPVLFSAFSDLRGKGERKQREVNEGTEGMIPRELGISRIDRRVGAYSARQREGLGRTRLTLTRVERWTACEDQGGAGGIEIARPGRGLAYGATVAGNDASYGYGRNSRKSARSQERAVAGIARHTDDTVPQAPPRGADKSRTHQEGPGDE
ncbi:hypothetical protein DFH06DRAFT_1310859 [Mycena polygramma]|nr:hypothetical protein DFH06DRAFT_1310859 [Mycena polygramma]